MKHATLPSKSQFAPQKNPTTARTKALEVSGDIKKLDYQRDLLSAQLSELTSYQHQLPTAEHNYQLAQKTKMSIKHKPSKPKTTGNKPNRY